MVHQSRTPWTLARAPITYLILNFVGGYQIQHTREVQLMKALEVVEIRREAGVDQRVLAGALDMLPQRLSDIERGYLTVPKGFEARVCDALRSILQERLETVGSRKGKGIGHRSFGKESSRGGDRQCRS